jgi:hypothetical protein
MQESFPVQGIDTAAPVAIAFLFVFAFVGLITMALLVWVYCRIFSKACYPWAMGFLIIVPLANIIVPFILAFATWPVEKELEQLKQGRVSETL